MKKTWNELCSEFRSYSTEILLAAVVHQGCDEICQRLDGLLETGGKIVSALDDLNKAVTDMQAAVTAAAAELSKIAAEVAAANPNNASVAAAAAAIEAQAQALTSATASADATANPPAAPAP